jgi:hypothetical protein
MSQTEQDQSAIEEPFSLTLDDYGRLWLHIGLSKLEAHADMISQNGLLTAIAYRGD